MANCVRCKKPLTRGRIRRVQIGKRKEAICQKCYARIEAKGVVSIKADEIKKLVLANSLRPIVTNVSVDLSLNRENLPYRLFVDSVTLSRVQRVAAAGARTVALTAQVISDPTLPDREPDNFEGLTEIRISNSTD